MNPIRSIIAYENSILCYVLVSGLPCSALNSIQMMKKQGNVQNVISNQNCFT